jgi:hypothetical protein
MGDDDNSSMSAILTGISRRYEASRMRVPSRVSEPLRVPEPARVVEPARLAEPTRNVDYRWEGMRSLLGL